MREARRHLAVLDDPRAGQQRRQVAADAIAAAAAPLGGDAAAAAAALAGAIGGPSEGTAAAALRTLAERLSARLDETDRADADPVLFGEALGADESEMLRRFFRDEAHDHLEAITRQLLGAGDAVPDDAAIGDLLRTTHTLKGSAATVGLAAAADAAHRLEDRFAQLRVRRLTWSPMVADGLVFAVDTLRALVDAEGEAAVRTLSARLREQLDGLDAPPPAPIEGGETEPITIGGPAVSRADRRSHVLRVDPARIDRLMESAGELALDRTRIERRVQELRHLARDIGDGRQALRELLAAVVAAGGVRSAALDSLAGLEIDLAAQVGQLARLTSGLLDDVEAMRRTAAELEEGLTRVRMMTVRSLFHRLSRPVREVARAAGKRVELHLAGEETEFDKTVAEQIADPLVQLLRNAIAHGIEPEEERRRAGKPAAGQIRLSARHEGDTVWLEVADDGAGIDPAALRARFVQSGRWTAAQAAAAGDDRVVRAIFEHGVSTRDEADELAGRGVGLDMVRETIVRLGGDIQVSSTPGRGTAFTIRLPLTTALSQALLFKVGGQVYAIPHLHVVGMTAVEAVAGGAGAGAGAAELPGTVTIGDHVLALLSLHRVLGAPLPESRRVPAIVIEYAGRRLAVTCDRVIGAREVVVKSLGPLLASLPLYAGGTIGPSGKVQLILDVAALASLEPAEAPDAGPAEGGGGGGGVGGGGVSSTTGEMAVVVPAGRVLLVDDSKTIRESLGRALSGAGFLVDTADDGQRAWDMLARLAYDALVTDLEMPRLDGFGLLERVRDEPALRGMTVVVVTSRAARVHRERASSLGAAAVLPKPVDRQALVEHLRRLLAAPGA